jgi:hypothetical protein
MKAIAMQSKITPTYGLEQLTKESPIKVTTGPPRPFF